MNYHTAIKIQYIHYIHIQYIQRRFDFSVHAVCQYLKKALFLKISAWAGAASAHGLCEYMDTKLRVSL